MTTHPKQAIKRELSLGKVVSMTFELYRRDFASHRVFAGRLRSATPSGAPGAERA
jgi:hypothetical protein